MTMGVTTEGRTIGWARLYDLSTQLFGGRVRSLHRRVLELAAIAPGERVLDVGCGPGRLTEAAAIATGSTGETVGIDPSGTMIELARRRCASVGSAAAFHVAAVEAIPAPDDHFDVVLATLMIHHLPPDLQRRGVGEVRRVLRPHGRFVIADFSVRPGHGAGHLLSALGLRRGSDHAEHLRSLLAAAGFEPEQNPPTTSGVFCLVLGRKPPSRG